MIKVSAGSGANINPRSIQMFTCSLSEKAMTFTNDSGDGILENFTSGNDIIFRVNNGGVNDILKLESTGFKVIVNTDLHLYTTSDDAYIENVTTDKDIIFKGDDGGSTITALTLDMSEAGTAAFNSNIKVGGNVIQASDGGSTITMDTSDNVTIGGGLTTTTTATVGTDLTVTGGDIILANAQNGTLGVAATAAGTAGRDLTMSAGTAATAGSNNTDGGDLILNAGSGDGTGTSIMTFNTKVSGTDAVAERMRIHTNGNVGIGTAAPDVALDIESAEAILRVQDTTDNYVVEIMASSGPVINFGDNDSSTSSYMIIGAFGGRNQIDIKSRDFKIFGATGDHFFIDESEAKVGIGTNTPDEKLSVNGDFACRGMKLVYEETFAAGPVGSPPGVLSWTISENSNIIVLGNSTPAAPDPDNIPNFGATMPVIAAEDVGRLYEINIVDASAGSAVDIIMPALTSLIDRGGIVLAGAAATYSVTSGDKYFRIVAATTTQYRLINV